MMKKYHGTLVPLVTPFDKKGKVDRASLGKLLDFITSNHCHPMALGTTGEAISMTEAEKLVVIETLALLKSSDATLFACISDTCMEGMVNRSKLYADKGIDVLVAHLPAYYPLSAEACMKWYELLAEQSPLPVMIYNIPATTHLSIPLDVVDKLSYHPNIVGLKDSERNEDRLKASVALWKNRSDFSHFTGWAAQSFEALKAGSDGIIPSSANVVPQIYHALFTAALNHDEQKGQLMQQVSDEIGRRYQQGRLLGESLAALKILLNTLDLCSSFTLPPIFSLSAAEEQKLRKEFMEYYTTLKPVLKSITADGK